MPARENPVLAMMRSEVFHRFEIHTNSGAVYDIRSREMIALSPSGDLVVVFDPVDGVALVDIDQVADCIRPITRVKAKSK